MLCIICGRIFDPTPLWICSDCQKEIDRVNERVEMMYLLKEAYKFIPEEWLSSRIERLFELKGKPL
jgi:NMD protein affecting ribosome stability and mRNA decay